MSAQVVLWRRLHELADQVVDVPPERHPDISELVDKLARLIDTNEPDPPTYAY